MSRITMCVILFLVAAVNCRSVAWAKKLSDVDRARVQELYQEGLARMEAVDLDEAMKRFQAAIEVDKKHAPSFVGLGNIHLELGELKAAEKAFRKALKSQKNYPPALNGLGLVFRRSEKGLQWATKYFKQAYIADPSYADAYCNLAETYKTLVSTKELDTYRKLVDAIPDHSDAWFQLGRIYQKGIGSRYRDNEKAEASLRRQLEVNPSHWGAQYQLGSLLRESDETQEAEELLKVVADTLNPYQRLAVVELSVLYQQMRQHDESARMFEALLAKLDPDTQAVYYDLSLVAKGEELARFKEASKNQWKSLSKTFWAGRDPAPITAANERLVEHYRRVAHALENFGDHQFPWDVRGEVYVRYGDPQHVSSSEDIRVETVANVVNVKERLIRQGGKAYAMLVEIRDPLKDIGKFGLRPDTRTFWPKAAGEEEEMDYGGKADFSLNQAVSTLGWPIYPVVGYVWEYWIYTDLGLGIEVTFMQPNVPGPYEYARMPSGISQISRTWQEMNPAIVITQRLAPNTPEVYRQDFASGPLDFFFDSARFRGERDSTSLEVYYGIPVRDLTYVTGAKGKPTAHIMRGVALFDEDNRPVHRSSQEMVLYAEGDVDTTLMAFVPELDHISVWPGNYRMSVQILDTKSEKSQVYNQQVTIEPYGEKELKLSDIQLAASIKPTAGNKFSKGKIEVVPNPSRAYLPGHPVFIYYEIYNLTKDNFEATKYRVSYEVRSIEKKSISARILGGLGQLLGKRKEEEIITIEYEHRGEQVNEQGYLQLDMSKTEPSEQLLKVRVTDEVSGKTMVASTTFTIK